MAVDKRDAICKRPRRFRSEARPEEKPNPYMTLAFPRLNRYWSARHKSFIHLRRLLMAARDLSVVQIHMEEDAAKTNGCLG
jgi:hypothetical protein